MKQTIINTIDDMVQDFIVNDRKEDEDLSAKQLDEAIANGVISINQIAQRFKEQLQKRYQK